MISPTTSPDWRRPDRKSNRDRDHNRAAMAHFNAEQAMLNMEAAAA